MSHRRDDPVTFLLCIVTFGLNAFLAFAQADMQVRLDQLSMEINATSRAMGLPATLEMHPGIVFFGNALGTVLLLLAVGLTLRLLYSSSRVFTRIPAAITI